MMTHSARVMLHISDIYIYRIKESLNQQCKALQLSAPPAVSEMRTNSTPYRGGSVKNASANAQTAIKKKKRDKKVSKKTTPFMDFFCDEMSKGATEHSQVRRLIADDVITFVYLLRSKQPRIIRAPKSARARERVQLWRR